MKEDTRTSIESTNDAYQQRVDGLKAANKIKTEEAEKARKDSGIVSVETPFSESAESKAIAADPDADGAATAGTEKGHAPNEVVDKPADNEVIAVVPRQSGKTTAAKKTAAKKTAAAKRG